MSDSGWKSQRPNPGWPSAHTRRGQRPRRPRGQAPPRAGFVHETSPGHPYRTILIYFASRRPPTKSTRGARRAVKDAVAISHRVRVPHSRKYLCPCAARHDTRCCPACHIGLRLLRPRFASGPVLRRGGLGEPRHTLTFRIRRPRSQPGTAAFSHRAGVLHPRSLGCPSRVRHDTRCGRTWTLGCALSRCDSLGGAWLTRTGSATASPFSSPSPAAIERGPGRRS